MKLLADGSVSWLDKRDEIRSALEGMDYAQTLQFWAELEASFTSAGLLADYYRNMILVDRYFLVTQVLMKEAPQAVVDTAMREWLFHRCREVEAMPDNALDLWARGHFKTTFITEGGAVQEVLKDPTITIGIFSHTKKTSVKILGSIKQHFENNAILKSVFPDILYQNPGKQSPRWTLEALQVKRKSNTREATIEAHGVVEGQPTGSHFRLRIYDDLVTIESVSTPDQIEKTTNALAISQNLGMKGGRVQYIGTRYAHGDTYQHMIEKGQIKKVRRYPCTDDGTVNGKPVLLTQEELDFKFNEQGPAVFACQMLLNPNAGSEAMFNPMDLRVYQRRPTMLNVYILVDPSGSKTKSKATDPTAMMVVGVDANYNKFLLDGYCHRMGLREKWQKLSGLYHTWSRAPGVQQVFVGYEQYGGVNDIEHMEIEMERTGFFFEIKKLATPQTGQASKLFRMARLDPDVRGHKLFLPALVSAKGYAFEWDIKIEEGDVAVAPRMNVHGKTGEVIRLTNEDLDNHNAYGDKIYGVRPIRRINSEEPPEKYDLTLEFLRQIISLPNSAHDDMVDAVSRIYDMDMEPPRATPTSSFANMVFED